MWTAEQVKMSVRPCCVVPTMCTNSEEVAGRNGKRRRCGRRVRGVLFENTACGNVTYCEECALIHARECEVRLRIVQRIVAYVLILHWIRPPPFNPKFSVSIKHDTSNLRNFCKKIRTHA